MYRFCSGRWRGGRGYPCTGMLVSACSSNARRRTYCPRHPSHTLCWPRHQIAQLFRSSHYLLSRLNHVLWQLREIGGRMNVKTWHGAAARLQILLQLLRLARDDRGELHHAGRGWRRLRLGILHRRGFSHGHPIRLDDVLLACRLILWILRHRSQNRAEASTLPLALRPRGAT